MDQRTVRFPGGLIWGEARRNNCVFRDSVLINYDQIPKINLGPDTTICADRTVLLKAGADAERYIWQDGSTKPTLLAETGGIYRLEAINGVCSAIDSVVITSTECFYFNVYVPNAFSPNNDGVNDELLPFVPPQIQVVSFEMNIFDRWGNLVFKTTDPTFSWDGRWNGKEMPIGVYIYSFQMEYIDDLGPGQTRRRGDFMLLK
jgi:gliding motility-associated-like protein